MANRNPPATAQYDCGSRNPTGRMTSQRSRYSVFPVTTIEFTREPRKYPSLRVQTYPRSIIEWQPISLRKCIVSVWQHHRLRSENELSLIPRIRRPEYHPVHSIFQSSTELVSLGSLSLPEIRGHIGRLRILPIMLYGMRSAPSCAAFAEYSGADQLKKDSTTKESHQHSTTSANC